MIGDAISASLPLLRAHAESLMVESCTIERESLAWDEAAQASVSTWTLVHSGRCAVAMPPQSSRTMVAEEAATLDRPVVKVPVSVAGIRPDDRVTVAGVGVFWVTHVPVRSHQVQRRLECRWVR